MLIKEVSAGGTERTWCPPVTTRIALAVCLGVFTAPPGLLLALTLVIIQVPDGGWIALALAVAVWGVLAWRALTQSVTLTPDALVIRNILATERVPLADVTTTAALQRPDRGQAREGNRESNEVSLEYWATGREASVVIRKGGQARLALAGVASPSPITAASAR